MPVYDYLCQGCGPFTVMRPMAESAEPYACPDCGTPAPRAFLTFPNIAGMDPIRRQAFATNERNAHAPTLSRRSSRETGAHAPGCACCSGKQEGRGGAVYTADGAKTFPSRRPWMISH
jgi:putative FmdB family regulatory protein